MLSVESNGGTITFDISHDQWVCPLGFFGADWCWLVLIGAGVCWSMMGGFTNVDPWFTFPSQKKLICYKSNAINLRLGIRWQCYDGKQPTKWWWNMCSITFSTFLDMEVS
jgi:hypothetical protein